MARKSQAAAKEQEYIAPKKLLLLFTVVNRKKAEFYADFLQSFEVNMQLTLAASGTASSETLNLLGLADNEKSVSTERLKRTSKHIGNP